MTTKALAAVVLALGLALAGCSSDSDKSDKSDKKPDSAATAKVELKEIDWPAGIPKVAGFTPVNLGVKLSSFGTCKTAKGPQSVSGELTSDADEPRDFLAMVAWQDQKGTVVGKGHTILKDVQPGATEKFTIKAQVKRPATICVPVLLPGTAK